MNGVCKCSKGRKDGSTGRHAPIEDISQRNDLVEIVLITTSMSDPAWDGHTRRDLSLCSLRNIPTQVPIYLTTDRLAVSERNRDAVSN